MLLTVETVVRPDEVVPVPPLEVVLGPPELHQRLSHGGGEPVARAPAECTVHRLKHEEFRQAKDSQEFSGRTKIQRRGRKEGETKTNSVDMQSQERRMPTIGTSILHGRQKEERSNKAKDEPSMDWSSRERVREKHHQPSLFIGRQWRFGR